MASWHELPNEPSEEDRERIYQAFGLDDEDRALLEEIERREKPAREAARAQEEAFREMLRLRAEAVSVELTNRMRPRPLLRRIMRRYDCEEFGVPLPPPNDEEVQDAIRVLEEGPMPGPLPDPVHTEAQRVMDDYSA